jgi:spermidine/putrescine transport system permease protein
MRRWLILALCALFVIPASAQSQLHYDVQVATTGSVALVDTFPASFQAEKINISRTLCALDDLNALDFVVTDRSSVELTAWGDSVYSYADSEGTTWTIWRNRQESKNRSQRVLVQNGRNAFMSYVQQATAKPSHAVAWMGWILAGLLLIAGIVYGVVTVHQRRRERDLPSVQRETLRRKRVSRRRHIGSQAYLWLLLTVLYAPIALIAVFSFTESKILGNWTGFSFDLYVNLFSGRADAGLNSALIYTVVIALVAAVCSTLLGTLAAIGIYNMRARQRKIVSFLNSVPMINPDIITGISLFLLFVALGFSQGLATVCIAHVVFCTPYVVLSVLPRLSRMNPNTYEAALDLGATPSQALRMVMLPELWPGMLSGFILALTLSVDDFGVTFFTKGSGGLETLSTFIYSDARKGGLTPELRPLFTIILIVMLAVLIYINIRNNKQEEK